MNEQDPPATPIDDRAAALEQWNLTDGLQLGQQQPDRDRPGYGYGAASDEVLARLAKRDTGYVAQGEPADASVRRLTDTEGQHASQQVWPSPYHGPESQMSVHPATPESTGNYYATRLVARQGRGVFGRLVDRVVDYVRG